MSHHGRSGDQKTAVGVGRPHTFLGMACILRRWLSRGWRSSQKAAGREGLCRPLLVMLCKGFLGS